MTVAFFLWVLFEVHKGELIIICHTTVKSFEFLQDSFNNLEISFLHII
jgi:hypothetical protein